MKNKHLKLDYPIQRIIVTVDENNTANDVVVEGDSLVTISARWQASEELSALLGTTRKSLSKSFVV